MSTLAQTVEDVAERATSAATTRAAARAMADELRDVTERYLGGDLTMSGAKPRASARIEPQSSKGSASVETGGAYGLADLGRRRAVPARGKRKRGKRGRALRTPWGPRVSVDGSTWAGFDITERAARDVFKAGTDAVTEALEH